MGDKRINGAGREINPTGRRTYGESLAYVYDALMREDYSYARYAAYIEAIFKKYGAPPDTTIADLGCGTGSMCLELAANGYDVIGIDNSPYMLAEARDKAISGGMAEILFLEQDIGDFELSGAVGAFISTIDSINYITDKRRLRRLFRLADHYLLPGGLFIFDINTVYKLSKVIGNGFFYEISDDLCYLWNSSYNGATGVSACDLTFFASGGGGGWRRFDERHIQRAYTRDDIAAALSGTGFTIMGAYDFLDFKRPSGTAKKINFILKKNS